MKNTSEVARKMIELYHETAEKCIDEYGTDWMKDESDNIYYDGVYDKLRAMLIRIESNFLNAKIEKVQYFISKISDERTEVRNLTFEYQFKYIDETEELVIDDYSDYSEYAEPIVNVLVSDLTDDEIIEIFSNKELIYFLHRYVKYDLDLNEYSECLYDFGSDLSVEEREHLSMNAISNAIKKLDEIYATLEK